MIRCCIFACTNTSQEECIQKKLFGTSKMYEDKALRIKKNDILFLYNLDSDTLLGPFVAKSDGMKNIDPKAWRGFYPYQVKVKRYASKISSVTNFRNIVSELDLNWKNDLFGKHYLDLFLKLFKYPDEFKNGQIKDWTKKNKRYLISNQKHKPLLDSTTLWDYPTQSYGSTKKGNNKYAGVTPASVIFNMVKRYTEWGDLVVDPMAGSGTTIDVCKEEHRRCKAFDIVPTRSDIKQNDARKIPLKNDTVDMVFIDSPYSNNIHYNDHPQNIGHLSAESDEFYQSLDLVSQECHRILKPDKVIGWLIGDQWVKKKFTPVGFKIYTILNKYFEPLDVISVVRRNQSSNTGIWHNRALRHNFYLRGFKYLLIFKKQSTYEIKSTTNSKTKWQYYNR